MARLAALITDVLCARSVRQVPRRSVVDLDGRPSLNIGHLGRGLGAAPRPATHPPRTNWGRRARRG